MGLSSQRGGAAIVPRHSPFRIQLTREERRELEARARKYTSPYRDVIRAKVVLLAARGLSNDVIATRLDTPRQIVSKWRKRFALARLPGLEEQPRGGRPALLFPRRRRASEGRRLSTTSSSATPTLATLHRRYPTGSGGARLGCGDQRHYPVALAECGCPSSLAAPQLDLSPRPRFRGPGGTRPGPSYQELGAHLVLKISNLPTQRRL